MFKAKYLGLIMLVSKLEIIFNSDNDADRDRET